MTPCSLVDCYQHFEWTVCSTLQGRRQRRDAVLLWNMMPTKRHIVVTEEVAVWRHIVRPHQGLISYLFWCETVELKKVIEVLHRTPASVVVTCSPSECLDSELVSKLDQPVKLLTSFRELPSSLCLPVTYASLLYCHSSVRPKPLPSASFFHSLFINLYIIRAEYSGYRQHR